MKISQFLSKGVGVLSPEKPYLKTNTPPLPVKKSNPERSAQKSRGREGKKSRKEKIGKHNILLDKTKEKYIHK